MILSGVPKGGQLAVNVVHFSKTPLAGAPIRLVQALRQYTDYNVRLVDLKRWGRYDHDVIHAENPDEVRGLAEKADIIHLHNYLDYGSKDFYPVVFDSLRRQGKFFLRHFHSTPMLVAREMGISVSDLLASPIPSVVIAQFQERFYPKARVVPNIISQDDSWYMPTGEQSSREILFSPTGSTGAWEERWNTKGARETMAVLQRVRRETDCAVTKLSGVPLSEVMRRKRAAAVIIDDLVTGSYHLSGLEGLIVGRATLAFLDDRVQFVLREIAGCRRIPFVNVRLEEAFEVLLHLMQHPDEADEIGRAGREWMERYWSEHILAQHFVDVYEKLLTDPGLVTRQESLRLDNSALRFHAVTLPDLVYRARADRYHATLPIAEKAYEHTRRWVNWLRGAAVRYLPCSVMKPLRSAWHIARRLSMGLRRIL